MPTSAAKKSSETLLIDQTIGKTSYDVSQQMGSVGLEGMIVGGSNMINISQSSEPVDVTEIDRIFEGILKDMYILVAPDQRELAENLILSLKSESYKGNNAQIDIVEIILGMIADLGERPFRSVYDRLTDPNCPLADVFSKAACKIGKEKFKLDCLKS